MENCSRIKKTSKNKIAEFINGFGIEGAEFIEAMNKGDYINVEENNINLERYEDGINSMERIKFPCYYYRK